jgi:DNA repair protein RadC
MAITDWPEGERPRERLINEGAAHLSDAELLAIFLRTGAQGKSAVDLAREIMTHFGSLKALFSADLPDFREINGIGPAKYAQLQAILELSRRLLSENMEAGTILNSPRLVREYLQLSLYGRDYEVFVVLFLDVRNRLIDRKDKSCPGIVSVRTVSLGPYRAFFGFTSNLFGSPPYAFGQ